MHPLISLSRRRGESPVSRDLRPRADELGPGAVAPPGLRHRYQRPAVPGLRGGGGDCVHFRWLSYRDSSERGQRVR